MQKEGFTLELLVDGKYVEVPNIRIHKAPPESCESCSS